MAKTKFKQIFEMKWEQNKELFDKFFMLNSQYDEPKNRKSVENEFQNIGKKVQRILYDGENLLCGKMSTTGKAKYSASVAEKYWKEVKKYFKYVDHIGVITEYL